MKKHILTIDDEPEISEMLQEALVFAGYRVSAVTTSAQAMEVVRSDPPQLVITDLQLPDSDGFEIIELVKAVQPDIPIILLTGVLFDKKALNGAVLVKVSSYIEKTAPLGKILGEVKKHIMP